MAESVLDKHKLYYEDMETHKTVTRKGGKAQNIMAKATEVKTENTKSKKYAKTRGEHLKDILIAVLVVGVVAFMAGVHYSDNKNAEMQSAVKNAQATAVAPVKK